MSRKPQKLWIMSDLHLESVPHPQEFKPVVADFDILVVAGDVWQGNILKAMQVLQRLARGKPCVFVLGNHEHWNGEVSETIRDAKLAAKRHGIAMLDNGEAEVAGVRFVGGTLWADGKLGGLEATPAVRTGEQIDVAVAGATHPITAADAARLHAKCRGAMEKLPAMPRDRRPVVAVTHHAPHPLCMPEKYRRSWTAGISASDLSHLADRGDIALWVHGHIHDSIDFTRPGGTRILCNPAGRGFENPSFQDDLAVEV